MHNFEKFFLLLNKTLILILVGYVVSHPIILIIFLGKNGVKYIKTIKFKPKLKTVQFGCIYIRLKREFLVIM